MLGGRFSYLRDAELALGNDHNRLTFAGRNHDRHRTAVFCVHLHHHFGGFPPTLSRSISGLLHRIAIEFGSLGNRTR